MLLPDMPKTLDFYLQRKVVDAASQDGISWTPCATFLLSLWHRGNGTMQETSARNTEAT